MIAVRAITALAIAVLSFVDPLPAEAAEGGLGTYLLGSKGSSAAVTPNPGWYFQNDLYLYSGDVSRDTGLPRNNQLDFGVDGSAAIALPTIVYISSTEIAGGRLGFTVTAPVGNKDVEVDYSLAGPLHRAFSGDSADNRTAFGDPKVGALLGWNSGNWHYQLSTQFNVPIGDYNPNRMSNISFNRWSTDVIGAVTWLDPQTGFDISGAAGVTFNGTNHETQYKTGTELHFEAAAVRHFNKQFDAGFIGYHYQQISGDSGPGASGPFEGRVSAIGLTAGYNFVFQERPVSLRVKYFKEFNAKNRAEGDAAYLTVAFPITRQSP